MGTRHICRAPDGFNKSAILIDYIAPERFNVPFED
jgi:hypothetical protein